MPFDSVTINTYFELEDEDSEEYQAFSRAPNYNLILKKLTKGKYDWKKSNTNQVQSFMRTGLIEIVKSWFYFVSSKLIPTKNISTVKMTRLYSLML